MGTFVQLRGTGVVIPFGNGGVGLEEGVGVEDEAGVGKQQNILAGGIRFDDRLDGLEQERQGGAGDLGILLGKVDGGIDKRREDGVDRHRPEGAAGQDADGQEDPGEVDLAADGDSHR